MPTLRSAVGLPADARRAAGLDVVARDCGKRLDAMIVRPLREEDDWSIEWTRCGCDLCDTAGRSRFPVAAGLRAAAGDGRTAAHPHPDRLGRAAGAAPDPAARGGRACSCWQRPAELFTREQERGGRP